MVNLYDDGDNSDEILRVTNYFANSGNFNLIVVALNRNTKMINEKKELNSIILQEGRNTHLII